MYNVLIYSPAQLQQCLINLLTYNTAHAIVIVIGDYDVQCFAFTSLNNKKSHRRIDVAAKGQRGRGKVTSVDFRT